MKDKIPLTAEEIIEHIKLHPYPIQGRLHEDGTVTIEDGYQRLSIENDLRKDGEDGK